MTGLGERYPSTLSPQIMTGMLREELGFKGVIVSDDLEMDAIIDRFSLIKAVLLGIHAGCDAFLVCRSQYLWLPLCSQILAEAQKDDALSERIFASAHRILEVKRQYMS